MLIINLSGMMQQLLERLEKLFPEKLKAWRKETNLRLELF